MRKLIALSHAVIAVNCLWASAALAASVTPCASFSVARDDLRVTYNPFSSSAETKNFVIKAERGSSDVATVRAFLRDPTPSGSYPKIGTNGPAEYDITDRDNSGSTSIFVWNSTVTPNTGGLNFEFGNTNGSGGNIDTTRLQLSIPALQATGPGSHRQGIDVIYTCYSRTGAVVASDVQTTSAVEIDLDVARQFGAFTGTAGVTSGSIDFGAIDVTSNTLRTSRATVTVLSSVKYDMSVASLRGFMLRQKTDGAGMPYTATIDDKRITPNFSVSCPSTGPSGRNHPVIVTLDPRDASKLPAGAYSDTLTITFEPRDGVSSRSGASC